MTTKKLRKNIGNIIFETNTRFSKLFDVVLLILILVSIALVMLESVESYSQKYLELFLLGEWILTGLFTIEYCLRLRTAKKKNKYIFSFYGLVDLISILPAYIGLFLTGAHALAVVRALRLLRIFRILKLNRYVSESNLLVKALQASGRKIFIFLVTVIIIVIITGSIMYLVEGSESGFSNIPQSIYRAIVTITTVGYGDMAPTTSLGQFLASILMIVGYGIIAVPTGIVTAEMTLEGSKKKKE